MSIKTEFYLTLFDDASNREKDEVMSRLEIMFDDSRNELPTDYYYFADSIPFGSKIKVTFELCSG